MRPQNGPSPRIALSCPPACASASASAHLPATCPHGGEAAPLDGSSLDPFTVEEGRESWNGTQSRSFPGSSNPTRSEANPQAPTGGGWHPPRGRSRRESHRDAGREGAVVLRRRPNSAAGHQLSWLAVTTRRPPEMRHRDAWSECGRTDPIPIRAPEPDLLLGRGGTPPRARSSSESRSGATRAIAI
jgi:hypothetical protein